MSARAVARVAGTSEWLARAAVLSVFDLAWIVPVERLDEAAAAALSDFLAASCERVVDAGGTPWWQLRDTERARTLRTTPRAALRAALDEVTSRPDSPVQEALTRYVTEEPVRLEELDAAGLSALLQLERWLGEAALPDHMSADDLRARLDWLAVIEPLRRLTARGFYGRAELFREVLDFIERDPEAGYQTYAQRWRQPGDGCFFLEGVGGSGKSSVLARLVLGLTAPAHVVAYLSFDRGWLIDGGQWALFDEILRQVGAQLPEARELTASLRRHAQDEARGSRGITEIMSRSAHSSAGISDSILKMLPYALPPNGRLVVVLDTLEELARRHDALTFELFGFLDQLREALPGVRVIGAGRTLPDVVRSAGTVRRLAGLEPADAFDLIRALTAGTRVTDGALREIIDLVGGNPLSLHLAADVLTRTGANPAQVIAVIEGNVQGQLYSRLLEHIRDPRVRAVAHPGLVVRRITPEIISEVLAGPCGIAPLSDYGAHEIFRALRREATLCEDAADGGEALVHRQDVRAIMLPAIRRDRPATTREIHEAAVRYYRHRAALPVSPANPRRGASASPDQVAARELLYHLLMLDEPAQVIDAVWDAAAGDDLAMVLEEFPVRGQLYLTTKVSRLRVDPQIRAAASDEEWRQVTRPRALALMEAGRANEALSLVRERRDDQGQPLLPDVEVEALERLGQADNALRVAATARERAAQHGDVDLVRALITAQARICERLRRWDSAWDLWQSLAVLDRARRERTDAFDEDVRMRELAVLTSLLRVARNTGRTDQAVADLAAETVALAERTPERLLTGTPALLRDLAAEIGQRSPAILTLAGRNLSGRDVHARDLPFPLDGAGPATAIPLGTPPPDTHRPDTAMPRNHADADADEAMSAEPHATAEPDSDHLEVDWYVEATEVAQDYLVEPDEAYRGDAGDDY